MTEKSRAKPVGEGGGREKKAANGKPCPVCGAPDSLYRCESCGWGVEELDPFLNTSLKSPLSTMFRARQDFSNIKKEIKGLKDKTESLIINNRKLSELVEAMEKEIGLLRTDAGKKYVYRYEMGGWRQSGDIDAKKLHLDKKNVTVGDINSQLREIMRLLKRHKKK